MALKFQILMLARVKKFHPDTGDVTKSGQGKQMKKVTPFALTH